MRLEIYKYSQSQHRILRQCNGLKWLPKSWRTTAGQSRLEPDPTGIKGYAKIYVSFAKQAP